MICIMSRSIDGLFRRAKSRTVQKGERLFMVGDAVAFIYRVRRGALSLTRTTSAGTTLLLQMAAEGDVLAEASAYSDNYHCDAEASEASVVETVAKTDFRRALLDDRQLAEQWEARLSRAVQAARVRAEIRSLRTVSERVDAWLGSVETTLPKKGNWQHFAAELGVSREALYRELAARRRRG